MHSPLNKPEELDRSFGVSRVSPEAGSICFAAVFVCAMSATSAVICAVVRGPLGSPHWFVFVKAFLLLAAAVSCVLVLTTRHRQGHAGVVLGVIAILFLPCLAWLDRVLADVVIYPILLGVVFVGIWRFAVLVRGMARPTLMLAVASGCGAGICYFFVVNAKGYATVLTPEQAVTGLQHLDTLFHASIANMLVKTGHLSTGLDGFLPIKYHVLSHIWIGCIGLWLGVTTLESYYLVAQIIAIPLLFFSLIAAGALLRRPDDQSPDSALVTFVPLLLLAVADLWGWTSYLVSESYFLSLLLFLFAMPLFAEIADERSPLRPPLFALAIAGTLVLFSKISVGVIFWGATGFLLWRRTGPTALNLVKLALPIGLLVGLASMVSSPDAGTYVHTLRLLSFAREYPRGALPNIVANLVLLYGAASLWLAGSPSEKRLAETFALFAIGSLVPAVLLDIAGGSAFYFANVGTFACIAFLTAYGVPAIERRGHWAFRPAIVLGILIAVGLATDEKRNSPGKLAAQFRELNDRVHALTGADDAAPLPTARAIAALLAPAGSLRREIGDGIKRVPGTQSIETLLSLSGGQTRHLAVFVAPGNRPFWTTYLDCRGDPFIIPAILGVPMLKGINPPEFKCARDIYYTTSLYRDDAISEASTDEQLCARASGFGLDTLLVLSAPREGRKVSCAVPQR
ncbi:hypothetical protein [Bradyrhizobium commune]|uniref:Uncharacterized protein n=1 Tax=Bradyrhizobium commune TaxID=83627 RepID=A0A7S9D9V9_9BRAD|nr:hypothetical protein [Bradyrhizobium commune]QPF93893.1 hypothetical protein IC761_11760 [Bradyrhizobium commune]